MRTKKTTGRSFTAQSKKVTQIQKSDKVDLISIGVIDLFCGAGGLAHGFFLEGIHVLAGIDADPSCRYPFEVNNSSKFIHSKIEEVSSDYLEDLFDGVDVRIIASCAPCQPFSTYYSRYKTKVEDRWGLLRYFLNLVRGLKPHIITMENVPRLRIHPIFKEIYIELQKLGYHMFDDVIYCPDYGIPQTRRRLVMIGSLLGPISILQANYESIKQPTVRSTIGDYRILEPIEAGEHSIKDPLHKARALSDRNLERIKASKPGGTWKSWNDDLIANCHKAATGKSYGSVYGRMEWDKPAPTITTQFYGFGNGRFGHPEQNRAISLREAALLQTFPKDYKFVPPYEKPSFNKVGNLIGNAVPVRLGRAIAQSIKNHLRDNNAI